MNLVYICIMHGSSSSSSGKRRRIGGSGRIRQLADFAFYFSDCLVCLPLLLAAN